MGGRLRTASPSDEDAALLTSRWPSPSLMSEPLLVSTGAETRSCCKAGMISGAGQPVLSWAPEVALVGRQARCASSACCSHESQMTLRH